MKKKLLGLLVIMMLFITVGCKKDGDKIVFVSNIELGKKQYIEQLKQVPIDGTDDYLIITQKVKWEVPEHDEDTTVSFVIPIPYTLHVDGQDYSSEYYLGGNSINNDNNPKYNLEITNLTSNYETEVLITKK